MSSVIPAEAGIQFMANLFATRSKSHMALGHFLTR